MKEKGLSAQSGKSASEEIEQMMRECPMTAERFLAQVGYSDSRPHSATAIAKLMEDYAAEVKAGLLRELAEEARRNWLGAANGKKFADWLEARADKEEERSNG